MNRRRQRVARTAGFATPVVLVAGLVTGSSVAYAEASVTEVTEADAIAEAISVVDPIAADVITPVQEGNTLSVDSGEAVVDIPWPRQRG